MRFERGSAVWLVAAMLVLPVGALAHVEGTPEFPCDEGPFAVPGLTDPPAQIGQWGPVLSWPVQATHSTVMHNGNVLIWRDGDPAYEFDPVAETLTARPLATNALCSGHGTLPDGRVMQIGGSNVGILSTPETNVFNPATGAWTALSDMAAGRWYPTQTSLPDGRILAVGGQISTSPTVHKMIPEIYNPVTDTFTELTAASIGNLMYPFLFVQSDGTIFAAGPGGVARSFDIRSQTWTGSSPPNLRTSAGSAAMYAPGKILKTGGQDPAIVGAEVIDLNEPSPTWRLVSDMAFPRRRLDLVLLPDGIALGVGGAVDGESSPECAVHSATVWDPNTELWTQLASMQRPRVYHSSAVLLPDGRVLAAGGENSHDPGGEQTAEIFSPPYLFNGPRPTVTSAPATITYDDMFQVVSPDAASVASINLMRPGSVTHNFDQNQRIVPLSYSVAGTTLDITSPFDANIAPPGYYMLFLVNGSGVPSVASWIRVAQPCDDATDNDADTFVDFPNDPGCSHAQDRSEEPDCSDGLDNDGDGLIDAGSDPGCDDAADASERSNLLVCDDGIDQDGDGPFDFPGDLGCTSPTDPDEDLATLPCDDGIDNDGDTFTDYPDDPGCGKFTDTTETQASLICDDGVDNDGDTLIDFPDDPECTSPEGTTEDGDTDGDGVLDIYETGTGVFVSETDTGTDPNVFDTDGDGWGDGAEVAAGANPNDASSIPRTVPALGPWAWLLTVGGILAGGGIRRERLGRVRR